MNNNYSARQPRRCTLKTRETVNNKNIINICDAIISRVLLQYLEEFEKLNASGLITNDDVGRATMLRLATSIKSIDQLSSEVANSSNPNNAYALYYSYELEFSQIEKYLRLGAEQKFVELGFKISEKNSFELILTSIDRFITQKKMDELSRYLNELTIISSYGCIIPNITKAIKASLFFYRDNLSTIQLILEGIGEKEINAHAFYFANQLQFGEVAICLSAGAEEYYVILGYEAANLYSTLLNKDEEHLNYLISSKFYEEQYEDAIILAKRGQDIQLNKILFDLAKRFIEQAASYARNNDESKSLSFFDYSFRCLQAISLENPYYGVAQQAIKLLENAKKAENSSKFIIDCSDSINNFAELKIRETALLSNHSHLKLEPEPLHKFQRITRSAVRGLLHRSIFNDPQCEWPRIQMQKQYQFSDFHYRVEKMIVELTENQQVVNGYKLFHYTPLINVPSIVDKNGFYGNASLRESNVLFIENVLAECDKKNLDGNVICFTPANVDRKAFMGKNNRCRITLDINKSNFKSEKFNQFFKLSDFGVGHHTRILINEDLAFEIETGRDDPKKLQVKILFKGYEENVSFTKNEMIFYGEIHSINRFCLSQLFVVMEKINDHAIKDALFQYLSEISDEELKKIFIIFSQGITLYAEYNFNGFLPLSSVALKEILILGDQKLKFNFSHLNDEEYLIVLQLLRDSKFDELKKLYGQMVSKEETILEENGELYFFGKECSKIPSVGRLVMNDLRSIPASVFTDASYIETRLGMERPLIDRILDTEDAVNVSMIPHASTIDHRVPWL